MTTRHTLTTADQVARGDFYSAAYEGGKRGILWPLMHVYLSSPDLADADGVAQAQARAAAGDMTLNGVYASSGVVTLDVPRNITIDSANAGDTTQTATVYGTDEYGNAMVETIAFNGTTEVAGDKAFKTVTRIAVSAATAGNINAGTGSKLGLPFKLTSKSLIIGRFDGAADAGTVVIGDTATPTGTTGDVRGTYTPAGTLDGTKELALWFVVTDTGMGAGGVAQYAG